MVYVYLTLTYFFKCLVCLFGCYVFGLFIFGLIKSGVDRCLNRIPWVLSLFAMCLKPLSDIPSPCRTYGAVVDVVPDLFIVKILSF